MAEMVKKATTEEIINHWILAVSCILLIITGYAFLFKLTQIRSGIRRIQWHEGRANWAGVVFTVSLFSRRCSTIFTNH
jgi:formate dehydrogenase subunit gamma